MSSDSEDEEYKTFKADRRALCQYDEKCYQKNPLHHNKYKHTPKKFTTKGKDRKVEVTGRKRKRDEDNNDNSNVAEPVKLQKASVTPVKDVHDLSPSPKGENSEESDVEEVREFKEKLKPPSSPSDKNHSNKDSPTKSPTAKQQDVDDRTLPSSTDTNTIISNLFLVEMPEDFYQFYEFCESISKDDPSNAFKPARLKLVGPYDVLTGNLKNAEGEDKAKYLRHWRYYYDPPEFQTVIKVDDKDGLHFGYWRDDASEKPVFVVRNRANVDCIIEPVGENLFAAVDIHIQDKLKAANPFEKASLSRLQRQLKDFSKSRGIQLEKSTPGMKNREKKVIARTFHRAGIVVPYNRKTQVGYRDLAVTDSELKKLLKRIEEAGTPEERKTSMLKLEEVVRLAVIAADECDFGTCLELGHDLIANGSSHVQHIALQMLRIAYTHLQRPQFLEIAKVHLEDRRKGSDLRVI